MLVVFFFLSFLKRSLVNTHAHTPHIDRLLLSDSSQFEITFFLLLLFQSNPFGWDSFSFLFFLYIIICDLIVDKGGKKRNDG